MAGFRKAKKGSLADMSMTKPSLDGDGITGMGVTNVHEGRKKKKRF